MSKLEKASELFETSFDVSQYFESLSSEITKKLLIEGILDEKVPLVFLLGESGVGKTYMLNVVMATMEEKDFLFASEPFSTPESFLQFLLKDYGYEKSMNLTELKEMAVDIYKYNKTVVMIDEAQLLSETVLEFIRILSDTNSFTFILSMHKKEGEELLQKQHFLSRNHRVVNLEKLADNEVLKYITSKLLQNNFGELAEMFTQKQVGYIQKFSNGNFRNIKQILKHSFLIMDYATKNNHTKYATPTKCVITMAAIDLGFIDV